jgi:hypothetical protein
MSSSGRLRRIAGNLAALAVSSLLALGLAEVAVRAAAPQQLILLRPDIWQPVDTLGWEHRPNVRTTINTGEGEVPVRTDREGFRVGETGRVEAPVRLLVVGDSYLEAFQMPYERSLPGRLQEALPAGMGGPVAVRLCASGGWDPSHYLLATRKHVQRMRPAAVLVGVFLGNDIIDRHVDHWQPREAIVRNRFRLPRDLSPREWVRAFLLPVNDFLETRSHLYVLARRSMAGVRMRLGLAPQAGIPRQYYRADSASVVWDVTAGVLARLDAAAREAGARTLFVLIPASYQIDSTVYARWLESSRIAPDSLEIGQPNRRLGDAMRARGLAVLDVLPELREAAKRGERVFGAVDTHLNDAGHGVVAARVVPEVSRMLREAVATPARGGTPPTAPRPQSPR